MSVDSILQKRIAKSKSYELDSCVGSNKSLNSLNMPKEKRTQGRSMKSYCLKDTVVANNVDWWRLVIYFMNYSFLFFVLRREAPIIANTIKAPGVTAATAKAAESFNLSCRLDVIDDLLLVTGYRSDPHDLHKGVALLSFESQKEQLGIILSPKNFMSLIVSCIELFILAMKPGVSGLTFDIA